MTLSDNSGQPLVLNVEFWKKTSLYFSKYVIQEKVCTKVGQLNMAESYNRTEQ
jgi:hypothetical protein